MENNNQNDFLFENYPIDRTELGTQVKNLLTREIKDKKQNIIIDGKRGGWAVNDIY